MKWIEVTAEGDVGKTYAAQLPHGLLVRVLTGSAGAWVTEALTFVPAARAEHLELTPPPAAGDPVDPEALSPEDKALWEKIKGEDPTIIGATHEVFGLIKNALIAVAPG